MIIDRGEGFDRLCLEDGMEASCSYLFLKIENKVKLQD